jgi:hypothetical protein
MFRALLAHPQDVLHKQHLVYCVRIMSVGVELVSQTPVSLQLITIIKGMKTLPK